MVLCNFQKLTETTQPKCHVTMTAPLGEASKTNELFISQTILLTKRRTKNARRMST